MNALLDARRLMNHAYALTTTKTDPEATPDFLQLHVSCMLQWGGTKTVQLPRDRAVRAHLRFDSAISLNTHSREASALGVQS